MTAEPNVPSGASDLASLHCRAGAPQLAAADLASALQALSGWKQAGERIERSFSFPDFHATIGFVNALAWMANREDHHPDLQVSYNRCVVAWSTHDAGGVTRNDLICAARTDRLFAGE
jgi:4a-hydroxytetrahydrobiopterin dehydratase